MTINSRIFTEREIAYCRMDSSTAPNDITTHTLTVRFRSPVGMVEMTGVSRASTEDFMKSMLEIQAIMQTEIVLLDANHEVRRRGAIESLEIRFLPPPLVSTTSWDLVIGDDPLADLTAVRDAPQSRQPFATPDPQSGLKAASPFTCKGCRHYHGGAYNGVLLVCGMHPYGPGENCSDYEKTA